MTPFAPHFPLSEFLDVSDVRTPTPAQLEYAAQLSQRLELIRGVWGLPIVLTSWIRLDSATQHKEGTAIDFRPPAGVTEAAGVRAVQALQHQGLTWGQFIVYPYGDRHWHIALPTGQARQAILVQLADGRYTDLTPQLLAALPTTPRAPGPVPAQGSVALAAAALGLIALTRKQG